MGKVECGRKDTCLGANAWEQEDDGARANMEGSRLQGENVALVLNGRWL